MAEWADNWWDNDFDWSVYEWQKAHESNRFFMVRVGEGNTGVFAAGRFTSEPKPIINEAILHKRTQILHPDGNYRLRPLETYREYNM